MPAKTAAFFISLFLALSAFAAEWRPINPDELARKQSKTDPTADAEGLFRDVRIENGSHGANQNVRTEYVRMKIFTDRGREKYSDVKIEYEGKTHISDVSGRTIHPDGTVIELKKDAIFDKVEVKRGGLKVKIISFALPSVEPGSIIEYRFVKNAGELGGFYNPYIPLDVQTDYPVDEVTFHLKPFPHDVVNADMRYFPFLCKPERLNQDSSGFNAITVRNVPAYHDEPHSPPELAAKQWILVYYENIDKSSQDKYWQAFGREQYARAKERIKMTGEIKQAAGEIVEKGKTDDEKLALLAEYTRKNIKNIFGPDVTTEEQEAYWKSESRNSGDTFRRKVGNQQDIDFVFIALAQAAGYDARHALVADRRSFIFTPDILSGYFVNNSDAAVLLNDKWKFYDVSDEWSPPGTLTWPEQGVWALILDAKKSEWVRTPLLAADQTLRQSIASFELTPEGDLDGSVRQILSGNESIDWRIQHSRQNAAEREEWLRSQLKERFSDFEVSAIKITALPDASRPVGLTYHLHVKGYAQRTGKRVFFNPGFFAAGRTAYFTDATRSNIIYFPFPWGETDSVDIKLPNGFELDHADAPQPFAFPPLGKYTVKIAVDKPNNTVLYRRSLVVGGDQLLAFDPKNYQAIKNVFDEIHTNDEHMLTLKLADASQSVTK